MFEGLDGAGTTTQSDRLARRLRDQGHPVEVTKEPSNGPFGSLLRQVIDGRVRLDPVTLALAFAADRADHLYNEHNGVQRLLAEGRWVVCDRYVLSSLAYQPDETVTTEWLRTINRHILEPDVTVFIDTDPEECLRRIEARSSTSEMFHAGDSLRVAHRNYQALLESRDVLGRLVVVDGNSGVDEVAARVVEQLAPWVTIDAKS